MKISRRTNDFVNDERDAFKQNFYQLQYTYQLSPYAGINVSGYYVYGNAPRFQYFLDGSYNTYSYMNMPDPIVGTDTLHTTDAIGSYRLNQNFYGVFANAFYKKGNFDITGGIHANAFSSEHFMEVNWARVLPAGYPQNYQAYFNTGYKNELSAFAKITYSVNSNFSLFADLQIRNATFKYVGKDETYHRDTFSVDKMNWTFVNPKLGFRYLLDKYISIYGMLGRTSREPTRSDYFLDEFPHKNIKQNDLKPESVIDYELGVQYASKYISLNANLFYLDFTNQLVNTGQLNSVGTPITTNVGASNRKGFELDFIWKPYSFLWLTNSTSLMKNSINSYTQYFDSAGLYITNIGINYHHVSAALSPDVIINQGVRVLPFKWLYIELNERSVSKQYLDNTQDESLSIKSYYYLDAKCGISLKQWIKAGEPSLTLQCSNITNQKYTPSGNTSGNVINYNNGTAVKSVTGLYFPAATRNVFVTMTWKF